MMEEIFKNIYRIGIPLPNNPLKELNSYYIRGTDRDILIDTGFRCEECRRALEDSLNLLGSLPSRRDILITHLHSDHSGMADLFVGPGRHIYMSRIDLEYFRKVLSGSTTENRDNRFTQEGFPPALLDRIATMNPASVMALPTITDAFIGLDDGDIIDVGEYHLQTVIVPGHTPGNAMFWAAEQGIMFSGDHVLFDITPNITSWPGVEDSLGSYLDALAQAKAFPVQQTFPGHRKTGNFHARIDALTLHHQQRLQEAFRIIEANPGLTAYKIAGQMTWQIRARNWEEFPPVQKWFAVGECMAHLDHLRKCGKIKRILRNGLWRYDVI